MLIHPISEIGLCCPNFTGVDDKARNIVEKRKEVRSEAELGERFSQGQEQGKHWTNKGEGRDGDSNHVRLCQEKEPGDR